MLGLRLRLGLGLGLGSAKVEVLQKYTNVYFFFKNKTQRTILCISFHRFSYDFKGRCIHCVLSTAVISE